MRIYFNIDIFATPPGGLYRYAAEILRFLKSRFEVLPISFSDSICDDSLKDFVASEFPGFVPRRQVYNIGPIPLPFPLGFFRRKFVYHNTRWKIKGNYSSKIIREIYRPFITFEDYIKLRVHFRCEKGAVIFSPYEAIPVSFRSDDTLSVQMLHDIIPLRMNDTYNGNDFFMPIVESAQSADVVLTNSIFTRDDFLDYVEEYDSDSFFVTELATARHITRVESPERIEEVRSKYGLSLNSDYILVLSTIEPRKNHTGVLRAWSKIYEKIKSKKIQLVFAGSKEWKDNFYSQLSAVGGDSNSIVLTGFIDDEDLASLYSGCLFSVYPSFYEGFGLPVLESMSCGRFCLASKTTSIPEVVGSGLPMVDPASVDEIADLMLQLIEDRDLLAKYNNQALKNSLRFSWEETGLKTIEAISQGYRGKFDVNKDICSRL